MRKALSAIGAGAAVLPFSLLFISGPGNHGFLLLLINLAAIGLTAAGVVIGARGPGGKPRALVPWLACGALAGAGFIGPLRMAPFVLAAVLAFGAVAVRGGIRRGWGRVTFAGSFLAAALLNFACLWPFTLGAYRPVSGEVFLSLDLRVHTLLADAPLHDLWVMRLPASGGDRDLDDLNEAMSSLGGIGGNDRVALVTVLGAYFVVSRVFHWHDEACASPESSVRRQLTESDRGASASSPVQSPFFYQTEREALIEIQTCVGHAIYAYVMIPAEEGYLLYWAAYALRVGRVTPWYMALIDPLRKLIVFPSLMERFERAWRMKWVQEGSTAPGVPAENR